ncbi:MAG: hypothetical protein ACLUOS_14310 [Odoribacter splanchnicus]
MNIVKSLIAEKILFGMVKERKQSSSGTLEFKFLYLGDDAPIH